MERLIDANAFKAENAKILNCDFPYISEETLGELIDNAPTVDAVEVVRCKECKFYSEDEKWCRRLGLCGAFNENDFCSHGEKEDKTN